MSARVDFGSQVQFEQYAMLKKSWETAISKRYPDEATPLSNFVTIFYRRLFELSPEAELVFGNDLKRQTSALNGAVKFIFRLLADGRGTFDQGLKQLARLHLQMGVTPDMFYAYKQAVICCMRHRLAAPPEIIKDLSIGISSYWRLTKKTFRSMKDQDLARQGRISEAEASSGTRKTYDFDEVSKSRSQHGVEEAGTYSLNGGSLNSSPRGSVNSSVKSGLTTDTDSPFFQIEKPEDEFVREWTLACKEAWESTFATLVDSLVMAMETEALKGMAGNGKPAEWLVRQLQAQKRIVRSCWGEVMRMGEAKFISVFYDRFFEVCPEAQPLFKNNLGKQGKALTGAMQKLIKVVDNPDNLKKTLKKLGDMHYKMGVSPEMFTLFGESLRYSLHMTLKEKYTRKTDAIWKRFYNILERGMILQVEQAQAKHGGLDDKKDCSLM